MSLFARQFNQRTLGRRSPPRAVQMATRGLISSLLVGFCIAFSLVDCSPLPRARFTRGQQDVASVADIAHARIWADDPSGLSRIAPFSDGQRKPRSIDVLALSGGGAEGAFGAGLLVGWTEAGNRPEFSIVSGTSSGALIAPFAFLGASHDTTLTDLFTSGIAETLLRVDGLNAIFGSGAFKTEPLKLLVAHYIDEDLLHLVAAEHRRGRRLFVVTTNIDAQRTAVWNMGAIAASHYSERLQLFRDILVASVSAPGTLRACLHPGSRWRCPVPGNACRRRSDIQCFGRTGVRLAGKGSIYESNEAQALHHRQRKDNSRFCSHRRWDALDRCPLFLLDGQGQHPKYFDCYLRVCAPQRVAISPCCHST
jgi:hypothetical protein